MELRRFWQIVRKWYWLMALSLILAGSTSYLVSKSMTPIYEATVTLQVNQMQNPGSLAYNDLLMSQQLTKTYSELIRKRAILEPVIQQLNLNQTYESLASQVKVSVVRDTQLIQVTVQHPKAQLAADIANKIGDVFITQAADSQGIQISATRQGLRQQLQSVEDEIRSTAAALERLRTGGDSRSSEMRAAEEARLQSTLNQYQLVYSQLVKSDQDIALSEAKSGPGVRIADAAVAPDSPAQPKVMLNTMLAALVGLMLAAGVVFLIEYLDDTVKAAEDVEQAVALPTLGVVGVIPRSRSDNGNSDLLITANPKLHFGEAYRILRTNLQFVTLDHPCKTLLVTSAGPQEGKSFTLSNLGVVLAQAGKRVLLVDGDVRRPALHKVFNISNEVGLTNLLLADENADVRDYFQDTPYEGLRVLPCGSIPPNPTELLSSPRMAWVVAALKREADIVLFDSPPVMAVADASILGAMVDGVLLVVETGRSRTAGLVRMAQIINRPGAQLLGVVLNKFRAEAGGYYYYHYNYRYGHSEVSNESKEQEKVSG